MKIRHITFPLLCGKLALVLTALAVTVFTASCNDEDCVIAERNVLQLSVTAGASVSSRAIINDIHLPGGSQVGVSLTAENGNAYSGAEFFNIQYTASGEGDAQTWSSATPADLSVTAAKISAYYPYNEAVSDLTAIPVEVASQTDYMYARPVTGVSSTSPSARLDMQHALTNIRINLKKGTYTGTGQVSGVDVKAQGLATAATMHAETGALSNVTGSGTGFGVAVTDFVLSDSGYSQDLLMVPCTDNTSGEVLISVVVDNARLVASVPYTGVFRQGYSYTYNLTLDNIGLVFGGVEVTKWYVRSKQEQELEVYDNRYIVQVNIPSGSYTYYHNVYNFTGIIDWGDGTVSEYTTGTNNPSHTYAAADNYVVIATGVIPGIQTASSMTNANRINRLIYLGNGTGTTSMVGAFQNQSLLTEIPEGFLDNCTEVTDFSDAFWGCTGLVSLPVGLFDRCTKLTSIQGMFRGCSNLTGESPYTLIDGVKVHLYERNNYPEYFSALANYSNCYKNCNKLTDYKSIPATWR